jgi:hypothetical protein
LTFVTGFTESGKAERHYWFKPKISTCTQKRAVLAVQPIISLLAQETRKLIEGHSVELHHESGRHTEQQKHIRHKNIKLSISEYYQLAATPRIISVDRQDSNPLQRQKQHRQTQK